MCFIIILNADDEKSKSVGRLMSSDLPLSIEKKTDSSSKYYLSNVNVIRLERQRIIIYYCTQNVEGCWWCMKMKWILLHDTCFVLCNLIYASLIQYWNCSIWILIDISPLLFSMNWIVSIDSCLFINLLPMTLS